MRSNSVAVTVLAVVAVIGVLLIGWALYYAYGTKHEETFVIKDKITKRNHEGDDKYLIYTNKGTFEDTDTLLNMKFNSSDVYGQLEKGKTYTCTVNGFRVPLFSSYKNILKCHEAS